MGVFGVRGEVRFRAVDGGPAAIAPETAVTAETATGSRSLTWLGARRHHDRWLARFAELDAPEAARPFVGADVFYAGDAPALEPGEYRDADLVGCELVAPDGERLGRVVAVEHYPAQDCLVVGERRALVPLVRAFVRGIDVAAHSIAVDLPAGLLDPEAAD